MCFGITRIRLSRCKSTSQGEPLLEESRGGHELEQPGRLHRRGSPGTVKEGLERG